MMPSTTPCRSTPRFLAAMLIPAALATGCAASRFSATALGIPAQRSGMLATAPEHFAADGAEAPIVNDTPQPDVRKLPIFLGHTGEVVGWDDVLRAAAWADVIFVGEEHDDAVGHAVERAVMEDVASRWPGSALSMEMLERDEQLVLDDYLDGIIDSDTLATLTNSAKWAGEGSWKNWYQPIIDAAKDHDGTVVAANAPRRYVTLARREGYARVKALPRERRVFVEFPRGSVESPYRNRFIALMREMSSGEGEEPGAHQISKDMVDSLFRSQLMWDATMAGSVAKALSRGVTKVVHIAGRFHIGFEGGTVLEFRKRQSGAHVVTIVMSRSGALELNEEDRDLGDFVIYTGARPPEVVIEEEEVAEPTAEPAPSAEPSPESGDPESQPTDPSTGPDAR